VSRWIHWLIVSYTVYFNRRHRRSGHLFQGRFKSLLVEEGEYLLGLSRYLHLNPVRGARLGRGEVKERRERLRAYRWSSYPGYAGLRKMEIPVSMEELLGEMGGNRRQSQLRYRRFVEEGLLREIEDPREAAKWQAFLGSEEFIQRMRDRMESLKAGKREIKALRHGVVSRRDPLKVVASVAEAYGMSPQELLEPGGYGREARSVAMWIVWEVCDVTLREIGDLFGKVDYAAVAQRIRRTRQRRSELAVDISTLLQQCQKV
jgi:putative transposase